MKNEAIGGNRDRKNSRRYGNYERRKGRKPFSPALCLTLSVLPSPSCAAPQAFQQEPTPGPSPPLFSLLGIALQHVSLTGLGVCSKVTLAETP